MKKPLVILLALATLALVTYFGCFHFATRETRQMLGNADSMAWLRAEFGLTGEQAGAIAKLQADYEPHCMEMCERISKSGERLEKLLQKSTVMTPELEAAMREASQTQADCHAATLVQAFAISTYMAPAQAMRYRTMIAGRIMPGTLRHDTAIHR